ncbi:hypothetical protein KM043_015816 [Ampulex compressa]|nr:hypothetical protein KM043_015816 [Ampulex compressa]
MALLHGSADTPKNAVRLSKEDALDHQWEMLATWKPRRDVWPFTFGIGILATGSGFSGTVINYWIQKRLKTFHPQTRLMYTAIAVSPAILAGGLHAEFISTKILLLINACPSCLQMKAGLIQTSSAVAYPIFFATLMNMRTAYLDGHRDVPNIIEFRKIGKFAITMLKPIIPKIAIMFTVQTIVAYYITHLINITKQCNAMGTLETVAVKEILPK